MLVMGTLKAYDGKDGLFRLGSQATAQIKYDEQGYQKHTLDAAQVEPLGCNNEVVCR